MMSLPTSWLFGALAIASMILVFGLWPIVRGEMRNPAGHWYSNKAFWLAAALWTHGLGAVVIFASLLFAQVDYNRGTFLYLLWAGWGAWLVSKTAVIHVTGRLPIALVLYFVWTVIWLFWRVLE